MIFAMVLVQTSVASGDDRNRCGCYPDTTGACFCEKKATCGCPGECEPRGCEEKRDRELQKQIQEETKKAREAGQKGSDSTKEEVATAPAPTKGTPPARQRLTPAQAKQLGKLLDLYLGEHPGSGSKSIEEVHGELSLVR
jgi:hypothetical protein